MASTFKYCTIFLFLILITKSSGDKLDQLLSKHLPYCGTNLHQEVSASSSSANETLSVRIVGGVVANQFEFPWQISLRRWSPKLKRWYHSCGGSIIDNQWILTAAHCTMGKNATEDNFMVRIGEHDYSTVEGTEIDLNISKILAHKDFNMMTLVPDINLIKLAEPIQFGNSSKFTPICISKEMVKIRPTESQNNLTNFLEEEAKLAEPEKICYSSGWGKLNYQGPFPALLQKVSVNLVDQSDCKKAYAEIADITDGMICSGQGGKGTCEGDSGGPMQCLDEVANQDNLATEPRWTLYGLTSFAVGCAEEKYPSVAARVARYRDWIADTLLAN